MKIYCVAIFAVLLSSCGKGPETKRPNYSRAIKSKMDIQYVTHYDSWQGPDGFPEAGYSLKVLPTKGLELIDDYVLKNKWHKPWNVFLAVAGDKETIAVKYYNKIDIYADGQGSNILCYEENRRIADLWFADESLVVLWNNVDRVDTWWYYANIVRVGIDIWNPSTKTITTTLDIPCTKSNPFLQHTVGGYPSYFNPVCRDNSRVFINDGKTVSLYSINGDRIQVVHEVGGEIWKCVVDGDKLLLEDRVYSADNRAIRHEKVYDISNMQMLKSP